MPKAGSLSYLDAMDSKDLRARVTAGLRRPLVQDALLAVGLFAVNLSILLALPQGTPVFDLVFPGLTWTGVVVAMGGTFPIALRRRFPLAVLVCVYAATLASGPTGNAVFGIGLIIALYTVAAYCRLRTAILAGALVVGSFFLAVNSIGDWGAALSNLIAVCSAWGLGRAMGRGRAQREELRRRAVELERERELRAELAVAAERSRIARDLHDVIAHSVGLMVVQANAAAQILDRDPHAAAGAIAQVSATGRESLTELRQLLDLLRQGSPDSGKAPQPGLAQVPALVESFRDTGMDVALTIAGESRAVASGVELSAYRIVQEALTNILKHADAAPASVALTYEHDVLRLFVVDGGCGDRGSQSGPPWSTIPGGHGLVGVRERAVLVGGTLRFGSLDGHGFAVCASLPLEMTR